MKHWIKIQQKLINLEEYSEIDEPVFMTGSPGYWYINAKKVSSGSTHWTFNSETECKNTYNEMVKLLTASNKFVE